MWLVPLTRREKSTRPWVKALRAASSSPQAIRILFIIASTCSVNGFGEDEAQGTNHALLYLDYVRLHACCQRFVQLERPRPAPDMAKAAVWGPPFRVTACAHGFSL